MNDWIPAIFGYAFSVIVGHFCIAAVVDRLWIEAGSDTEVRQMDYLPRLVGVVERVLFVASLQMGKAEFVGVWFALKVAGQWKRWADGIEVCARKIDGRIFFKPGRRRQEWSRALAGQLLPRGSPCYRFRYHFTGNRQKW